MEQTAILVIRELMAKGVKFKLLYSCLKMNKGWNCSKNGAKSMIIKRMNGTTILNI